MKNRLKIAFSDLNEFFNIGKVKALMIGNFIINIFYVFFNYFKDIDGNIIPFLDTILFIYTDQFYIIILLLVVLLIIIFSIDRIDNNYYTICRCNNKKEYFNLLIRKCLTNVVLILIYNTCLSFLFTNLKCMANFGIHNIEYYGISNAIYLPFYLLRYFVIILLISFIFISVLKAFDFNIGFVIDFTIIYLPFVVISIFYKIRSVAFSSIFYINYLKGMYFGSFTIDIIYSSIFIGVLFGICYILKNNIYKFIKKAGK